MKSRYIFACAFLLMMLLGVVCAYTATLIGHDERTENVKPNGRQAYFIEDGNYTIVTEYDDGEESKQEVYVFNGTITRAEETYYDVSSYTLLLGVGSLVFFILGIVSVVMCIKQWDGEI